MAKPSIPQGTRDFGPDVVRRRTHIFNTIKNVFELYGFQPLETPAMENLETLMGKYGEEGDKLIFKILNNGLDNPAKEQQAREEFEKVLQGKNSRGITERALKYDLTIPFARYVAMNHGQLNFPFKRYQVQPVWRADRPQKGRYREFYQCDADVVGSDSLLNEVELIGIYSSVFENLKIPVEIRINNRKILTALADLSGGQARVMELTMAIDKLDKIGLDKVKEELKERGFEPAQIATVENYLSISGSNEEKIRNAKDLVGTSDAGLKGLEEIEAVLFHSSFSKDSPLTLDLTLARGLNYYTATILEVKAKNIQMGSIGGGGRYDDLTGLFGLPNIPGVGISFGVDRIYDVMEELNVFPSSVSIGTQVLFLNYGEKQSGLAFGLARELREKQVRVEIYHEKTKDIGKQYKYAEKKNIPFVVIMTDKELQAGTCIIKNIVTGQQTELPIQLISDFSFGMP